MELSLKINGLRRQSGIYSILALAGVLGPIIFWAVSIFLASIQPGYSSIRHTLSILVYTPQGWLQTLDFCLFGVLVLIFSIGLYTAIEKRIGFKLSIILLFLMGLGILMIGIFPTDSGTEVSLHGIIHQQTVRVIGLLFPMSCFLMIPALRSDTRWKHLTIYTGATGLLVLGLIVGWILGVSSGWMDSWVGLYERVFFACAVIWMEVMAIRLMFLPSQLEKTEKEIGIFLSKRLDAEYWSQLGKSTRVVTTKIKNRNLEPVSNPPWLEASKYIAFGALLGLALRSHYRKKKTAKNIHQSVSSSVLLTSVMFWGAKGLGKRLGLSPVADLALTIIKDDERSTSTRN